MLCRNLTNLRTVASYFFGSPKTMYEFITGGAPAGSRAVGTSRQSVGPQHLACVLIVGAKSLYLNGSA